MPLIIILKNVTMKPYNNIHDFLQDKSFVEWVFNTDAPSGQFWEKMATNKGKGILINQAKCILLELDSPGNDWDEEDQLLLLSKIRERIRPNEQFEKTPVKRYLSSNNHVASSHYWKRVTTFVFVIFVFILAFLALDVVNSEEVAVLENEKNAPVWITKFNPKGQKSKIHLPDGSTVIINADSEIKFKSDFGVANREVFMTGESFFEVAPDSLLPFRVYSENLITTAIGTSFNINSYDPDHIRVQLATGKVEIVSELLASEPVFLKPGEELSAIGNQKLKKRKFNPNKAFLWKSGILLFDNTSLAEFKLTLERWYGVKIELINSPVSKLKISGEFKDTYLSNVLESIGYAYGFNYIIDQKKVKLVFTN